MKAGKATNPYKPPEYVQNISATYGISRLSVVLFACCLLSPIVACYLAFLLIIGESRFTLWLYDGAAISAIFNLFVFIPLIAKFVRDRIVLYLVVALGLLSVGVFTAYGILLFLALC